MLRRRFGRTELAMPVFSCGGMRFQQSWRAGTPVTEANQRNLEATLERAIDLGINHIETARGYGTSEVQLGQALARRPRGSFILQTKVAPTADAHVFEANLRESFARLRVDRVDLFAFHGLNNATFFDWTLREGGCFEVAERWRRAGRIGHIGFSTHAATPQIVHALESGRFDYVNLHYYYILQDHRPALAAAARQDVGVFIISPSDKGGRLYAPSAKLSALCAPLSPMAFNDLFCLSHPEIHTLSIGAARPSDFDLHVQVLSSHADGPLNATVAAVQARLEAAYEAALGREFAATWHVGLPSHDEIPGGINVKLILWLRNLALAFDLVDFARDRYRNLTGHDHWVPGANAQLFDEKAVFQALPLSPHRAQIPQLLREAHALLG